MGDFDLTLSREQWEAALRGVLDASRPVPAPPTPSRCLTPEAWREARTVASRPVDETALTVTGQWLRARAERAQLNRKRLAALLWAANELREAPDSEPLIDELGPAISMALARFGFRGEIPRTPAARRDAVEAMGRGAR